ncbi:MAG: ABC transporter permease, partial [Myxococcales bacterium]|nr:ABC transporter permease [Myxococcales bacterium]
TTYAAFLLKPERSRGLRRMIAAHVGDQMTARLAADEAPESGTPPSLMGRLAAAAGARSRALLDAALGGLEVAPRVFLNFGRALLRPRDFAEVFAPILQQALRRPLAFFAVVSTLLGLTLLYILHRSIGGGELPILPTRIFSLIGSMHVIALAPPLSAILFSATSASAVIAWLGSMSLTKQTTALRALGITEQRYLWVPAWLGLVLSYLVLALIFAGGLLLGGLLYLHWQVPELATADPLLPWELLTADILDPPPDRAVFRVRALALTILYALGMAGDAVAKGARDKHAAEDVTIAMVRGVMVTTSWIVALELGSLLLIYARP